MKRLTNGILIALFWAAMVACANAEDSHKIRLLIDSDANNETDDQHAIAYALLSKDTFEVEGITVNKTQNGGDVDEQMAEAVRVVKLCGFYPKLPMFKGANGSFAEILPHIHDQSYDGKEAVDFIVAQAKKQSDRKLVLLPIGKLTNIALALAKDPSIIPNVKIVWLGSNYPRAGEYNMTSDLTCIDYVLSLPVDFEMVTVRYGDPSGSWGVKAYQQDIFDKMPEKGPKVDLSIEGRHGGTFTTFGDYSVNLYKHASQHGDPPFRSFFDATAVAVLKDPGFGKAVEVPRPALNGQAWVDRPKNPVKMVLWEGFDSAAIMKDFYDVIDAATPN
ncbi:ribonucleoside hydrolase RihC [Planctomycetes bacterium CA13]|uniref:Ribonucleoside hydrolase RihC n=1 Tax=Novipirellula herctigrandis TaxID=2527986 RepID=A0A5C5ZBN1_9BACT|nr:ribonucleoside hydrolase RihC [Planctomycetes bacterium CA13]